MTIEAIRTTNINELVEKYGGRDMLAKKLGYQDTNYVNQLCKGHGSFGSGTARKIEKKLKLPKGWMDVSHSISSISSESSHNHTVTSNVEEAPDLKDTLYPLISWVQAGDFEEAYDGFSAGDAEEWMKAPITNCSDKTYVLRVKGDSMTAPYGMSYPEGILIYVDPEKKTPSSGDPIIAKINGDNAVTFKQYINDGGNIFLKPLNPTHLPITSEFRVLGTVVFAGFVP